MIKTRTLLALGASLLAASSPALAIDFRPDGASVEIGGAASGTAMAGVGLVWDWDFERMPRKAELTGHTEVLINRWHYEAKGYGHTDLTQFVLLPSLRMRLDRGRSPWYIELGIGASWMDQDFATPYKQFSTRWNFYDMLGIGHSFGGVEGQHEIGLRLTHMSNCGVEDPNPGQNFLQLRYVRRF